MKKWRRWLPLYLLIGSAQSCGQRPNIIAIIADDLGFNDVSFHGSDQIPTPNIDALCYRGIILNSHYSQPLCTPSRAAFLTGKYPIRYGLQHSVIQNSEPHGLPLDEVLLPQYLNQLNYASHIVGKWHLGFYEYAYTPLFRGFLTHFGYYNGMQDYYNHTAQAPKTNFEGLDMRRDLQSDWSTIGKYSTDLYTKEAVNIIMNHNCAQSLFLYFAHAAVHAGSVYNGYQAPVEAVNKFPYIKDENRRTYAGMVSKLDDSLGAVMQALRKKGMLQNCVIVFLSDNGAPTTGFLSNSGSNWPLRSKKGTLWEGGVRTPACVWSPQLQQVGRVSDQLMHISDWAPTLYSAAGGKVLNMGKLDGINMWQALSRNTPSLRQELLHNIDEVTPSAALRFRDLKLVIGEGTSYDNEWYGPLEKGSPPYPVSAVKTSMAAKALAAIGHPLPNDIGTLRSQATVKCSGRTDTEQCSLPKGPCLFDIAKDPCEYRNIFSIHPHSRLMVAKLFLYAGYVPASNQPSDPLANPKYWNNTWTCWRDYLQWYGYLNSYAI